MIYQFIWFFRFVHSSISSLVCRLVLIDRFDLTAASVFGSLDMSRANSMTSSGQCRLAPLILCIQDSCPLYDFIVKLLFRLHSSQLCILSVLISSYSFNFIVQASQWSWKSWKFWNLKFAFKCIEICRFILKIMHNEKICLFCKVIDIWCSGVH